MSCQHLCVMMWLKCQFHSTDVVPGEASTAVVLARGHVTQGALRGYRLCTPLITFLTLTSLFISHPQLPHLTLHPSLVTLTSLYLSPVTLTSLFTRHLSPLPHSSPVTCHPHLTLHPSPVTLASLFSRHLSPSPHSSPVTCHPCLTLLPSLVTLTSLFTHHLP